MSHCTLRIASSPRSHAIADCSDMSSWSRVKPTQPSCGELATCGAAAGAATVPVEPLVLRRVLVIWVSWVWV